MKPTDNERREVAARLRRMAEKHGGVVWFLVERYLGLVPDERYLGGSVYTRESVSRLADLIEPERTCHMEPVWGGKYGKLATEISDFHCDRCGAYVKSMVDDSKPYFCECCGARVVEEVNE